MLATSLTKSFNDYADVIAGSVVLNLASPKYDELKTLFGKHYVLELYVLTLKLLGKIAATICFARSSSTMMRALLSNTFNPASKTPRVPFTKHTIRLSTLQVNTTSNSCVPPPRILLPTTAVSSAPNLKICQQQLLFITIWTCIKVPISGCFHSSICLHNVCLRQQIKLGGGVWLEAYTNRDTCGAGKYRYPPREIQTYCGGYKQGQSISRRLPWPSWTWWTERESTMMHSRTKLHG